MNIDDIIRNPKLISTDSRNIKKGDVFVAIKGKNFDGHDFVGDAFKKGARASIVSKIPKISNDHKVQLIKVNDTVETLGDIAKAHRLKFNIPIIAITGSNGKTTTKDIVAHVLGARYNVLKNEASLNNSIGLPLTLFKLNEKHDIAVLEIGMNHLGEIDRLSEIAKPHIGVITNIGPSHLEFLGSLRNILIAKMELLRRLTKNDTAVLNKDDRYLRQIKGIKARKLYFSIDEKSTFQAKDIVYREKRWRFSAGNEENFELPLLGKHNIYNALVSILIAREFNIDFSTVKQSLKGYKQNCPKRLEFKNIHGVEVLDDSYNSNPFSMECAIDTLLTYNTNGKRIVVSGDMLELGKEAKFMHVAIGSTIATSNIDVLITIGSLSRFANKEARLKGLTNSYHAKSHKEAASLLKKTAKPGDTVLVKGSRGMEMDRVLAEFERL